MGVGVEQGVGGGAKSEEMEDRGMREKVGEIGVEERVRDGARGRKVGVKGG